MHLYFRMTICYNIFLASAGFITRAGHATLFHVVKEVMQDTVRLASHLACVILAGTTSGVISSVKNFVSVVHLLRFPSATSLDER